MKQFRYAFLLSLLLKFSLLASDTEEIYHLRYYDTKIPAKKPVLVKTYPVYQGNGTYHLFFLIEIQNDFLQFVYDNGNYSAGAEFEINLKNTAANQLRSKIFQAQAQEEEFRATNSRDLYHFVSDSFAVESGRYEVIFKYSDLNGKGSRHSQKFKIYLPPVGEFYASPILFTYPDKKIPNDSFYAQPSALRGHWGFNQRMGIQLNIWQAPPDTLIKINLEILETRKNKSIYSIDTLLAGSAQNKSGYFRLPENLFSEQEYLIKINYATVRDTIDQKLPLNVIWFEKPLSLWNIDRAIGPLKYVIKDEKTFQNLEEGNDEEKQAKLDAYWAERDPTPDTPFNELKLEFYSRVDSANVKYGGKRIPGWTTDIGEIYILYGPPDEVVDNSLAPISDPFLRWTYYLEDKQLSFTFLAVDGRKRYRLADVEENPIQ